LTKPKPKTMWSDALMSKVSILWSGKAREKERKEKKKSSSLPLFFQNTSCHWLEGFIRTTWIHNLHCRSVEAWIGCHPTALIQPHLGWVWFPSAAQVGR
jgi:hypothetical protein